MKVPFTTITLFLGIFLASTGIALWMNDADLIKLTYVQLSVVEAGIVAMLWTVRKWIVRFGPYLEGIIDALGGGKKDD